MLPPNSSAGRQKIRHQSKHVQGRASEKPHPLQNAEAELSWLATWQPQALAHDNVYCALVQLHVL